ncbi:MAG TPA: terminase family protein [Candidatus Dormibacteraeota bacterium]|nr:terminase family protein [Candidatus Dormibacteraeota bacterium]
MVTITSGFERWAGEHAAGAPKNKTRPGRNGRAMALPYTPFAKQQKFHASTAKYRLFGGAAGPGKSKALLMEAILQANDTPGSNTLLLRRTFPELEQSLLLYFRRDVPRELYKNFNESKHVVTWLNGSTTRFGYCQREHDVYQYQGAEFLFVGIDELTLFTLRQWQFLTSRNRCPVAGAFPCMAGATNPGNIGHAWVKSLWIDRQAASGMENAAEYDPADYEFIPARVSDNPIYAGDENYLKTLRALPSHLKRAFLDGDWEVFAGQYFDRFDFARHVARAEEIDWKPWWPRWISVDWGFEHPAAAYWHAATPADGFGASLNMEARAAEESRIGAAQATRKRDSSAILDGSPQNDNSRRVVTYREFVTRRTSPRDLAREIIARSQLSRGGGGRVQQQNPRRPEIGLCRNDNRWGQGGAARDNRQLQEGDGSREKIDAIYLSPDAFARRTDEASIAEQMGDVFAAAGFPRPIAADDDRVGGWMLMYQMLDAGEWLLTENCIELIRTLPSLVRDTARVEDVEKMDGDDPADAARYGLKSRYANRRAGQHRLPLDERLAARVLSPDPTIRAIQARKAAIDEARGAQPVSFVRRWRGGGIPRNR